MHLLRSAAIVLTGVHDESFVRAKSRLHEACLIAAAAITSEPMLWSDTPDLEPPSSKFPCTVSRQIERVSCNQSGHRSFSGASDVPRKLVPHSGTSPIHPTSKRAKAGSVDTRQSANFKIGVSLCRLSSTPWGDHRIFRYYTIRITPRKKVFSIKMSQNPLDSLPDQSVTVECRRTGDSGRIWTSLNA